MRKYLLAILSILCIGCASVGFVSCDQEIIETIEVEGYSLYAKDDGTYAIVGVPNEVKELHEWTVPEQVGEYPISALGEQAVSRSLISVEYWELLDNLGNIRKLNIPENIKVVRAGNLGSVMIYETEISPSEIEIYSDNGVGSVWYYSPQEAGGDYRYLTEENFVNDFVFITEEATEADGHNEKTATLLLSLGDGEITVPDTYKDLPVTKIGTKAFGYGDYSAVTIGETVHTIEKYAFIYSTIDRIVMPENMTKIPTYAFFGTKFSSFEMPTHITEIEKSAFESAAFDNIQLSANLVRIDDYAFRDSQLSSVKLPSSLQSLGNGVFWGSTLENVDLSEYTLTVLPSSTFRNCPLTGDVILSDSILEIEEYAFLESKLTSFDFPANLEIIGNRVFSGVQLAEIKLPSSVRTIEECAFKDNLALTEFILPDSCTKFFISALSNCQNLKKVYLGNIDVEKMESFPNLEEISVAETNKTLFVRNGILYRIENIGVDIHEEVYKVIKCPAKLNIKSLTLENCILSPYAFSDHMYLEEITLNSQEEIIPENAFRECAALKTVRLPDSVKTISEFAFLSCTKLSQINLEEVETFEAYAFENCTSLTTADFRSAKVFSLQAFKNCGFTELDLNGVSIGVCVFSFNLNLEKVKIRNCEFTNPYHLFEGCEKLTKFDSDVKIDDEEEAFKDTPLDRRKQFGCNGIPLFSFILPW